jgi:hypothetical protein
MSGSERDGYRTDEEYLASRIAAERDLEQTEPVQEPGHGDHTEQSGPESSEDNEWGNKYSGYSQGETGHEDHLLSVFSHETVTQTVGSTPIDAEVETLRKHVETLRSAIAKLSAINDFLFKRVIELEEELRELRRNS